MGTPKLLIAFARGANVRHDSVVRLGGAPRADSLEDRAVLVGPAPLVFSAPMSTNKATVHGPQRTQRFDQLHQGRLAHCLIDRAMKFPVSLLDEGRCLSELSAATALHPWALPERVSRAARSRFTASLP